MGRTAEVRRKTGETDISVRLDLDGSGKYSIQTDCGFMKHMLELFARHGRFDLELVCDGDSEVDFHHSVEDMGIALGQAFRQALGDKKGIVRYGNMMLPMDEALVMTSLDISGRTTVVCDMRLNARVGDFDTELVEEFITAFARELGLTIHVRQLDGSNTHHIIEAAFKGMARALAAAVAIDEKYADEIPSTKGVL
ncbi:MAG: imidazoleglycerol-phosphate dehydratase HisB [Anaerovoracaceae bacterium]|jgi:imidazoleglycerol-phosphate dehydratase